LQQLAGKTSSSSNVLKEVTSLLSEEAGRLKLGPSSADSFKTFEALEFLVMGVHGKLCLWRALQVAANADARLTGQDYQLLITRAEAQHTQIEEQRLMAAMALPAPNI
jgi:hypothetical protein